MTGLSDQRQQHLEGLRRQRHDLAPPQQQPFGCVQPESAEFIYMIVGIVHKPSARTLRELCERKTSRNRGRSAPLAHNVRRVVSPPTNVAEGRLILRSGGGVWQCGCGPPGRNSGKQIRRKNATEKQKTGRSEEHTSELQSL